MPAPTRPSERGRAVGRIALAVSIAIGLLAYCLARRGMPWRCSTAAARQHLADPDVAPHPLLQASPNEPQFWSSPRLGWVRAAAATPAQWYWSACEAAAPAGVP